MPGVSIEEMSNGGHEARMRSPRNTMRCKEKGEEGVKGKRQTQQYDKRITDRGYQN